MVYVAANCTGGGTHFPRLQKPVDRSWCRFIECDAEPSNQGGKEDLSQGVIFKPIAGNAVFWENMRSDGTGYSESWHAGLPVTKGSKVGLNIWSWRIDGYVPEEAGEQ
jgi:prolyl 4-hydroxylase